MIEEIQSGVWREVQAGYEIIHPEESLPHVDVLGRIVDETKIGTAEIAFRFSPEIRLLSFSWEGVLPYLQPVRIVGDLPADSGGTRTMHIESSDAKKCFDKQGNARPLIVPANSTVVGGTWQLPDNITPEEVIDLFERPKVVQGSDGFVEIHVQFSPDVRGLRFTCPRLSVGNQSGIVEISRKTAEKCFENGWYFCRPSSDENSQFVRAQRSAGHHDEAAIFVLAYFLHGDIATSRKFKQDGSFFDMLLARRLLEKQSANERLQFLKDSCAADECKFLTLDEDGKIQGSQNDLLFHAGRTLSGLALINWLEMGKDIEDMAPLSVEEGHKRVVSSYYKLWQFGSNDPEGQLAMLRHLRHLGTSHMPIAVRSMYAVKRVLDECERRGWGSGDDAFLKHTQRFGYVPAR
jgi:hypothetical protein